MRTTASCPCEACAQLVGVVTVRVAEDARATARRLAGALLPSPLPRLGGDLPAPVRWILSD